MSILASTQYTYSTGYFQYESVVLANVELERAGSHRL